MSVDIDSIRRDYDRDGYAVIECFLPDDLLTELGAETARFVKTARDGALVGKNFDIIDTSTGPELRRIADPEGASEVYDRAMRFGPLVDLVAALLGGTCRFDHGKLNFKPPSGGGALDWHQDFAFYPQTNDDMLAVGLMLEDCTEENGPLMVIPGSHKGPIYDHHQNGQFVGGVPAATLGAEAEKAVKLIAPAGSISIHHSRTLHASTANRGETNRPLLLFNYFANDAFPIFHSYDWDSFNARILRGPVVDAPRMVPIDCKVPFPTPKPKADYLTGSIFDVQQGLEGGAVLT